MLFAIGLIIWLVLSMLTMGTVCFFCAVLFWLKPNPVTHQMMWYLYVQWTLMLAWWVHKIIPDMHVLHQDNLPQNSPYILISNHYSWLDILILYSTIYTPQQAFVFVMKRSLIKIPMLGIVCWGLGHPLIYRGRARRKNLQILQTSSQKAQQYQYGVMIFPEGTRYTKKENNVSSYHSLLCPKTVGFQSILKAMGGEVAVVDVTLKYESSHHGVLDFIMGRIGRVDLHSRCEVVKDSQAKEWLVDAWAKKDALLASSLFQSQGSD
jgi:1-acyl-sn-glycerol-3-phosphate acyltransferase